MSLPRWSNLLLSLALGCGAQPPLSLLPLDPGLLCQDQGGGVIELHGEGLGPTKARHASKSDPLLLPEVHLVPVSGLAQGSDPALSSERVIPGDDPRLSWTEPDTLSLQVDEALGLEPGVYDVVLLRADGATTTLAAGLAVAGAPTVADLSPGGICLSAGATEVWVEGAGFLLLDPGSSPEIRLDDAPIAFTEGDDCADLAGPVAGQICTRIAFDVVTSSMELGDRLLSVSNPAPAACAIAESVSLEITAEPEIDSISPASVCVAGGRFEVRGGSFPEGTTVSLGSGGVVASVTRKDSQTLEVTVDPTSALGRRDLTVEVPGGCATTLTQAVHIAGQPSAFAVQPAVAPAGQRLVATVWIANAVGEIVDLWLEPAEGGAPITVEWSWDPADPGRARMVVPEDLASGAYVVGLAQDDGCGADPGGSLTLTADATIALEAADPPFAWTGGPTPITLTATDPLPTGSEGFEDGATAFLLGSDGASTAVVGLRFQDAATLTAIVPAGLEIGAYDLLVTNPSGGLGLAVAALEVLEEAPPAIASVWPTTLSSASDAQVEIQGLDFRDPSVAIRCEEEGVTHNEAAAVDSWDEGHIWATLPTTAVGAAVCLVEVINADGPFDRFAAVRVADPAQALSGWTAGPAMTVGRRAPGTGIGRLSSSSRFVYALGGDGGDEASALDSIEVARVDALGEPGDWTLLEASLPAPWTLGAATVIGRFVYTVGGSDGSDPLDTVWRAMILDPQEVPVIEGLDVVSAGISGLGGGTWVYRVSALFDEDWTPNPGGESAASAPFSLTLPSVSGGLAATLSWAPSDGAAGYRIYRSLYANVGMGQEAWIADVTDGSTRYTDWGDPADLSYLPLVEGALGAWSEVASLESPRRAPCLTWVNDPDPDSEVVWLFAAGGEDASGSKLSTIEALDIRVEAADSHVEGAWTTAGQPLSDARSQCGAFAVDGRAHGVVEPGEAWIFVGGGSGSKKLSGAVEGGRVQTGGEVTDWASVYSFSPARAGAGVASAGDHLYVFGGQQGNPSSGGVWAELLSPLPDLSAWTALEGDLTEARVLPGSAQEAAVIYLIGGETAEDSASTSMDWASL